MLYRSGPAKPPYREIGVSVKAEQNSASMVRVANDEAGELLSVERVVTNAAADRNVFSQPGWLKKYSLLPVP
jgi:hypothetical protein